MKDLQPLIDELREEFPNGHPDFLPTTVKEIALHDAKNHDYAAGGSPLGNFERVSHILSLYPGFPVDKPYGVALIYALKQIDAVLWGLCKNIDHRVEGIAERLRDISVYAKLASIMHRESSKE